MSNMTNLAKHFIGLTSFVSSMIIEKFLSEFQSVFSHYYGMTWRYIRLCYSTRDSTSITGRQTQHRSIVANPVALMGGLGGDIRLFSAATWALLITYLFKVDVFASIPVLRKVQKARVEAPETRVSTHKCPGTSLSTWPSKVIVYQNVATEKYPKLTHTHKKRHFGLIINL